MMIKTLASHFKKIDGEWMYFPFGYKADPNTLMEVKKGEKEKFEQAILGEWKLAYSLPTTFVGLIYFSPYLIVVPLLLYTISAVVVRNYNERKYCIYKRYSVWSGFDGYFKKLYTNAELYEENLRIFLLGSIFTAISAYVIFLDLGFSFLVFILIFVSVIFMFLSIIIVIYKINKE